MLDALRSQLLNEVEVQRVWKEIGDPLADPMLHALRDEITNKTRKQKNLIEAFANGPRIKQVEYMVAELEEQIAVASKRLASWSCPERASFHAAWANLKNV